MTKSFFLTCFFLLKMALLFSQSYGPTLRTFSRELLYVKDEKGNIIYDFTSSPCFSELGYNPEFSQAQNLASYKACEASKRSKAFEDAMPFILGLIGVILILWIINYVSNSNKRKWIDLRDHYDTDKNFKDIINNFLIPDNISFEVYNQNKKAEEADYYDKTNRKINCSYSFNKYLLDDAFERPKYFPTWFIVGYPDVSVWFSKNQGLLLNKYKQLYNNQQLNLECLRKVINDFIQEFNKLELKP